MNNRLTFLVCLFALRGCLIENTALAQVVDIGCVRTSDWIPVKNAGSCDERRLLNGYGAARPMSGLTAVLGVYSSGVLQPGKVVIMHQANVLTPGTPFAPPKDHTPHCSFQFVTTGKGRGPIECVLSESSLNRPMKLTISPDADFDIDTNWALAKISSGKISIQGVSFGRNNPLQTVEDYLKVNSVPTGERNGLTGSFAAEKIEFTMSEGRAGVYTPYAKGVGKYNNLVTFNGVFSIRLESGFYGPRVETRKPAYYADPFEDEITITHASGEIKLRDIRDRAVRYLRLENGLEFDSTVEACKTQSAKPGLVWLTRNSAKFDLSFDGCGRLTRPGERPLTGIFSRSELMKVCEDDLCK